MFYVMIFIAYIVIVQLIVTEEIVSKLAEVEICQVTHYGKIVDVIILVDEIEALI